MPNIEKVRNGFASLVDVAKEVMKEGIDGGLARASRVVRNETGMPFLKRLMAEVVDLSEKGRVGSERLSDPTVLTAYAELLDDLQSSIPDQRRFELLRRAFLGAVIGVEGDKDGMMTLMFVRVARSLIPEEAAVLGYLDSAETRPETFGDSLFMQVAMESLGVPFSFKVHNVIALLKSKGLTSHRLLDGQMHLQTAEKKEYLSAFGRAFCGFLRSSDQAPAAVEPTKS